MTEQLATFEVPRVSVDFLSDDLSAREKLTVLRFVALDDAIVQIGRQRFGKTITDNISLKPVRDWVAENWKDEFVYDLRERNVPITFRTVLALALLTTRMTEYLTQMGEVEVYASRGVQQAAAKHNLDIPPGLSRIDYASLAPEAKSALIMPIIGNLHDAETVARARYLFPNGISRLTVNFLNPGLIFAMLDGGNPEEVITFNQIGELDTQAAVAKACLQDIRRAREFQAVVGKMVREEKVEKEPTEEEIEAAKEQIPDSNYPPGTSFLDVFPYHEGETREDVLRAFRRITGGGYYSGHVDEPHRGEYLRIHIAEDGRLIGLHGADGSGSGLLGVWQEEIDMLSGRFEFDEIDARVRRKNVFGLLERSRDELDTNKRVITDAQTKYGQSVFTVEQGFLLALTDRIHSQATEAQIDEDKRLAREARKTARVEEPKQKDEETTELAVLSDQPVDKRTVELDYLILRAIKQNYSLDPSELWAMMLRSTRVNIDNIGDWFSSCAALLSTFQGVLVDTASLFVTLGIEPTNDLAAIRKAYGAIAFQNHPDKTSGLPAEEQVEAGERFLQATSAYHDLGQRVGHIEVDSLRPTHNLGRISRLFAEDI